MARRSWLLVSNSPSILARTSSNSALTVLVGVGPIIAGLLCALAVLLLLLVYLVRRRPAVESDNLKGKKRSSSRSLRLFGKPERSPSSYWDEGLWEKNLEGTIKRTASSSLAFIDRPLPAVPLPPEAPSVREESNGGDISSNGSRTKLRLRPDPIHVQRVEQTRQTLPGFTPARSSFSDMPPPRLRPPGLGHHTSRSEPVTMIAATSSPPNSGRLPVEETRSHISFSASIFSATLPVSSTRLQEKQAAAVASAGARSMSTIDVPPLTAHSRFPSCSPNDAEYLQYQVEILWREIRRLQSLLLPRRHQEGFQKGDDQPHPPPMYSS
ncbi:hypothetical protein C8R46DRAFT_637897 [Mycena filopes]|nr:hypothetical protein C8R46DRAFT_637897 [Mycena filopes]